MKLTAKLAYSQLKTNRKRTMWTLLGIILCAAMITAIYSFGVSGMTMLSEIKEDFYSQQTYRTTLIGIGTVLSTIIIAASIIVISNAFRVSAGERTTQFGILKSVGATKKQIQSTVMREGVFLSAIGIPVGITVGLFLEFLCVKIANYFLVDLNAINELRIEFRFIFSWQALVISAIVAFFTVLLSAWLPARKSARNPAIDAIRGAGEVKVKTRKIRANWLISKFFGFEGTLASKSLKRSRRNFRATVISLTISIVLMIAASSFATLGAKSTDMAYPPVDATVIGEYISPVSITYLEDRNEVKYLPIETDVAEEITEKMREISDGEVFGIGSNSHEYSAVLPIEMLTPRMLETFGYGQSEYKFPISLVTVDSEHYAELCEKAGVPLGSNILINQRKTIENDKRTEYVPLHFNQQTLSLTGAASNLDLPLHGELRPGEVPNEALFIETSGISVIVPNAPAATYLWFANVSGKAGFMERASTIIQEYAPKSNEIEPYIQMVDIENTIKAMRSTSNMLMVFVYGFVGMLTLIGLTNVISTISTNVRSRSREFAILQSVGMTRSGLKRMLNLESILCSAKSLIVGLPLGCAASYAIYRFVMNSMEFSYEFPWIAVLECILGVFAITWITMRYSSTRIDSGSIIETIRGEEGF